MMKKTIILFLWSALVLMIFSSCDTPDDYFKNREYKTCKMGISPYKNYSLDIKGRWTKSNFGGKTPVKYVSKAHFSPFVIFVHKPDINIFKTGKQASSGLEKLAEDGKTSIASLHDNNNDIGCVIVGKGMKGGESQKTSVPINNTYNTITILSMIAPSSDWFVAKKITLAKDKDALKDFPFVFAGSFKPSGTFDLRNYDAGTEKDDPAFTIKNDAEPSQLDITRIDDTPFSFSDVLVKVSYSLDIFP